jgi:ribosomal protein S18 acetylase RimI-like enzyme
MAIDVHVVAADEVATAALPLAEAFVDDPLKLFLCGGEELPVERSRPFFEAFMRIHLGYGHVYTTADHGGSAIWSAPGHWKIPISQIVRNSPRFLRLYGLRLFPNLQVLTDLERLHPTEPHYYLEFVGTRPSVRGKGYGAALIEPVIARADAEGVGCYLENSKEANLGFYARFGFEVRRTMRHRRNGPKQWLMWRDPR